MNPVVLALVLLVLVAAVIFLRKKRKASELASRPARTANRKNTAFHAVSIRFPRDACAAAKAMAGRRFLATAAPSLPLPKCDAENCSCGFGHHDDRRTSKDRRSPYSPGTGTDGTGSFERERRDKKDRRQRKPDF